MKPFRIGRIVGKNNGAANISQGYFRHQFFDELADERLCVGGIQPNRFRFPFLLQPIIFFAEKSLRVHRLVSDNR